MRHSSTVHDTAQGALPGHEARREPCSAVLLCSAAPALWGAPYFGFQHYDACWALSLRNMAFDKQLRSFVWPPHSLAKQLWSPI